MNRDDKPARMEDAWSIESAPKEYPYDKTDMRKIGERAAGGRHDRKFIFYMAPDQQVWYETRIWAGGKWVSQEEYVFGRAGQKRRPA